MQHLETLVTASVGLYRTTERTFVPILGRFKDLPTFYLQVIFPDVEKENDLNGKERQQQSYLVKITEEAAKLLSKERALEIETIKDTEEETKLNEL